MNAEKVKTLGYRLGQAMAAVLAGCLMSIVIAFTIKFIMWLF